MDKKQAERLVLKTAAERGVSPKGAYEEMDALRNAHRFAIAGHYSSAIRVLREIRTDNQRVEAALDVAIPLFQRAENEQDRTLARTAGASGILRISQAIGYLQDTTRRKSGAAKVQDERAQANFQIRRARKQAFDAVRKLQEATNLLDDPTVQREAIRAIAEAFAALHKHQNLVP